MREDQMNDGSLSLVREIFLKAEFIRSLGIELSSCGRGWCETRTEGTPALRQQHGFIHAGVLMTLADHTCGGAAASTVAEGKDVITVETKVSFLRPALGKIDLSRGGVEGREESHFRGSDGDCGKQRGAKDGCQGLEYSGSDPAKSRRGKC